jgi:hypothetical protein
MFVVLVGGASRIYLDELGGASLFLGCKCCARQAQGHGKN